MLLQLVIAYSFLDNHIVLTQPRRWASPVVATCSPGFFFHSERAGCVPCQRCDHFSIVRSPCRADRDTECVSCDGDNELQRPECQRCPPCPEGEFLFLPCTRRRLTECRPCPEGSYNPKTSYASVCNPCTSCHNLGRRTASACTASTDTVCGRCRKGYYSEKGSSECLPCRSCVSGGGQKVIRKCERDGNVRVCGRIRANVYRHVIKHSWVDDPVDDDTLIQLEEELYFTMAASTLEDNTTDAITEEAPDSTVLDDVNRVELILPIIIVAMAVMIICLAGSMIACSRRKAMFCRLSNSQLSSSDQITEKSTGTRATIVKRTPDKKQKLDLSVTHFPSLVLNSPNCFQTKVPL